MVIGEIVVMLMFDGAAVTVTFAFEAFGVPVVKAVTLKNSLVIVVIEGTVIVSAADSVVFDAVFVKTTIEEVVT